MRTSYCLALLALSSLLFVVAHAEDEKVASPTASPAPTTASLPLTTTLPPPDCPRNAFAYDTTRACFWTIETRMKWDGADRACGRQGGKLASITDEAENAFAFDVARRSNLSVQTVWLGRLAKIASTGAYEWHDGAVGRHSDAFRGLLIREPPTGGGGACVTMWLDFDKPEGSWHEWDCGYAQGYAALCKKTYKITPKVPVNVTTTASPLDDWYHARRCCTQPATCNGQRCATNERCIPDDMDCMWRGCTGIEGIGYCLPMP